MKTIFKKFREYVKEREGDEKIRKYGEFVNNLYSHGADLTAYIKRITFEDPNVYVKAVSAKKPINKKGKFHKSCNNGIFLQIK